MHRQNKKTYIMLDKKKYRLLTSANKFPVVTVYDRLNEALSYQDEFIDFCCFHLLDFQVVLFSLNSRGVYVLKNEHFHEFIPCEIETTVDLS